MTAAGRPEYVAPGPDNTLWFTEKEGNRVGRVSGVVDLVTIGDPPASPPPADVTKPELTRASLFPPIFRSGKGTTIRFTLSEAATVRFRVDRKRPGKLSDGRCVKPKRSLRKKRRCTRFTTVGAVRREGAAGRNGMAFSGAFGKKALKPGAYRLLIGATDAARNRSTSARVDFRVTAAPSKKPKRG